MTSDGNEFNDFPRNQPIQTLHRLKVSIS